MPRLWPAAPALVVPALAGLLLLGGCRRATPPPPVGESLGTAADSVAYIVGYQSGRRLSEQMLRDSVVLDRVLLARAFRAGLFGDSLRLPPEDVDRTFASFQDSLQSTAEQRTARLARRNEAEATAFLEANGQRDGVTTTESGLQFEVLEEGDGPEPIPSDLVEVRFTGRLIDDTVFAETPPGETQTFAVASLVDGLIEALTRMEEGAQWRVYVPPALGYGTDAPLEIGPQRLLVFDVELVRVVREPSEDGPE